MEKCKRPPNYKTVKKTGNNKHLCFEVVTGVAPIGHFQIFCLREPD